MAVSAGLDEEALKNLVKQLDVNKDGKITRDEVPERLRDAFDRVSGGQDRISLEDAQKRFVRLNRQTDGS